MAAMGHPAPMASAGAKVSAADREQLKEHPVTFSRVGMLFAPHKGAMTVVTALIVASALLALVPPFLTRDLIDHAIPKQDVRALLLLAGGIVLITMLTQAAGIVQTYIATRVGQQIMHRLRTDLFEHLQRQPLAFFTRTRGGELQSRLTNDINGMQSVVTDSATSIASNVTTTIGTSAAMVALSWRLSLISLVVLPPAIWLSRKVARMRREVQSRAQRTLADMQTQIEESLSISGIMVAKTLNAGPELSRRFTASSEVLTELELASKMAGRWRMGTMAVIFAAIPAVIYLAAGLPATSGGMSIGTLVAFTTLQAALFRPLMGVLNVGIQVTTSKALFSRVFEYLDLPVALDDPAAPVAVDVTSARGEVRLEDVTFRYEGADRDALVHVEVVFDAGKSHAIVGSTGSGKSTMAALIARLADPTSGRVMIDGVDVRSMRLRDVAGLVGVVSQETYLLHATIAENLRFAKPDATDAELIAAAKAAQVHDVITALPQGYGTVVGARGHRFSGGEKQRIAIARTLLRNPPILLLDEATSALDNATERALQEALTQLARGRTVIAIAHRLSTVRHADQIVVLEHGQLVQRGTFEDLSVEPGRFAQLQAAQGN